MGKLKILLVEDSDTDIAACLGTIKRYQLERHIEINCIIAKSKDEALSKLDSTFDGAIIDIKLADTGIEGNDVIAEIHSAQRIPIAVLTGTPEEVTVVCEYLGCFKKGETGYEEIIDMIMEVHVTGITKILGGRGILETAMTKIFWDNLLPQLSTWKAYCASGKKTEQSILRMVLNHLLDLLNNDENPACPEEMYIVPPLSVGIKTGSIVLKKLDGKRFIVISPPCDLVVRAGGVFKTDKVQLAELAPFEDVRDKALNGIVKTDKKISKLSELLKNNYAEYYHWLPDSVGFIGGFINFRWTLSVPRDDMQTDFEEPLAQLSAPYVKELIARYSAFYARQGQPDLDFEGLAVKLVPPSPVVATSNAN